MQYVLHDLVELALSARPPDARLGSAAAVETPLMDVDVNCGINAARYANDINDFLDELDGVEEIAENLVDNNDDDDLLELDEANFLANNNNRMLQEKVPGHVPQ